MIPTISPFISDSQRDAAKYQLLLNWLTDAIKQFEKLEKLGAIDRERLLNELLPLIANTFNVECTFAAKQVSHDTNQNMHFEVRAVYPDESLIGKEFELSERLRPLLVNVKSIVIDPPGVDIPEEIAGLGLFKARTAILVRLHLTDDVYIVGACNKTDRDISPFLNIDRDSLTSILDLIAVGIRNTERNQREYQAIQRISEVATTGDPNEMSGAQLLNRRQ